MTHPQRCFQHRPCCSQDGWKGSETILHRGLTESANIQKATKLTENANSQKAIAIHWRGK